MKNAAHVIIKETLSFYIDISLVRYYDAKVGKFIYFGASSIFQSHFEYKWIIDNNKCKVDDWVLSDNFMDGMLV